MAISNTFITVIAADTCTFCASCYAIHTFSCLVIIKCSRFIWARPSPLTFKFFFTFYFCRSIKVIGLSQCLLHIIFIIWTLCRFNTSKIRWAHFNVSFCTINTIILCWTSAWKTNRMTTKANSWINKLFSGALGITI